MHLCIAERRFGTHVMCCVIIFNFFIINNFKSSLQLEKVTMFKIMLQLTKFLFYSLAFAISINLFYVFFMFTAFNEVNKEKDFSFGKSNK